MRLTMLGTGTPGPSLERMSSGYLVEVGGDMIVFDHGPGAHHRLLESGRRAVDVTHCFFTHLHYDHCMDYGRLVMTRWDQGAGLIGELKVFGPPPLARMTDLLFGEDGVYGPDLEARTKHQLSLDIYRARSGTGERLKPKPEVREIEAGSVVEGSAWRVTTGYSWHAQPYLSCLSYRIDGEGGSLCYAGDSGGVCPGVVELAQGANVLITMNSFFTGTEKSEPYRKGVGSHLDNAVIARDAGVETLVLTHLSPQIDRPGFRERIVREIGEIFDGNVILGADLMALDVSPGGIGTIGPTHNRTETR